MTSFTCTIGSRVLHGLVKERNKAKALYDRAVAKGATAGLLEQLPEASDVFSTKLGNIPAGESVIVEIIYVGELKHDAETNGIRFTIPTSIAPRYGQVAGVMSGPPSTGSGIRVTVDVSMTTDSFIQGIQSPSHPIAVSLGTTSTDPKAEPSMNKASATLSLGETALERDFVLIILAKDTALPRALLETHPTIPNHRALMVTLVPKFSLPPSVPEIVFVADRSASMDGKMEMVKSAMNVFLQSLPVGVKFNICSYGSTNSFLWPKSKTYNQDTLNQARNHVENFMPNMGGTETHAALKATIENRWKDIPLEIVLLTDGDIWQQELLFAYLNHEVTQSKGEIRIFPLGIGRGVSHALIEGVARAGNGFAQTVQDGEKLDNRVVRMLKGALTPHVTDYTLEVKYDEEEDDGFEMIDKVTDGMRVLLSEKQVPQRNQKSPISLFDTSADVDGDIGMEDAPAYAHLPKIPHPKLLQAPHRIPPLFSFTRAVVYLLISPEAIQRNPKSVVLNATSAHGPLHLEIPVDILPTKGETIHQLAARKAVQDFEEGRGWLYDTKDENNVPIQERFPSRFDEIVEKEAVRLGTQFQAASKWCSFVAVADNDKEHAPPPYTPLRPVPTGFQGSSSKRRSSYARNSFGAPLIGPQGQVAQITGYSAQGPTRLGASAQQQCQSAKPTLFSPSVQTQQQQSMSAMNMPPQSLPITQYSSQGSNLFGASVQQQQANWAKMCATPSAAAPGGPPASGAKAFRAQLQQHSSPRPTGFAVPLSDTRSDGQYNSGIECTYQRGGEPTKSRTQCLISSVSHQHSVPARSTATDSDKVHALIGLQNFQGYWEYKQELQHIFGDKIDIMATIKSAMKAERKGGDEVMKVWITCTVIAYLKKRFRTEEGVWELVVEKARGWVDSVISREGGQSKRMEIEGVCGTWF